MDCGCDDTDLAIGPPEGGFDCIAPGTDWLGTAGPDGAGAEVEFIRSDF